MPFSLEQFATAPEGLPLCKSNMVITVVFVIVGLLRFRTLLLNGRVLGVHPN